MADLVIWPAVAMGAIIGLIELIFVHSDEGAMGMTWLTHALHALPVTILFVFASMNITFIFHLIGKDITENFILDMVVRLVIAALAMLKIAGAAAIAPGARGVGEKIPHTLMIGALVFAAPYLWEYVLVSIVSPYLP